MFPTAQKKFKNFKWYYEQLQKMDIPFPEFKNSKYLSKEDRLSITSDKIEDLDQNKINTK